MGPSSRRGKGAAIRSLRGICSERYSPHLRPCAVAEQTGCGCLGFPFPCAAPARAMGFMLLWEGLQSRCASVSPVGTDVPPEPGVSIPGRADSHPRQQAVELVREGLAVALVVG